MVAYYKHDIAAWMNGTEGLSDGEYRAYHVICQMIYLHNGPITHHETGIAGRCKQHPLTFRKHLRELVDTHKKLVIVEGKIDNERAQKEIEKIQRHHPPRRPTSARPPGGVPEVDPRSTRGGASKPLKNQHPVLPLGPVDENRYEEPNGSSPTEADVRTQLVTVGLQTLVRISGKPVDRARAIIGKWLRESVDDAVAVLRAIEDADRNRVAEPLSWIEAALRSRDGRSTAPRRIGNAFAAMAAAGALEHREEML